MLKVRFCRLRQNRTSFFRVQFFKAADLNGLPFVFRRPAGIEKLFGLGSDCACFPIFFFRDGSFLKVSPHELMLNRKRCRMPCNPSQLGDKKGEGFQTE
ncbi:hypothetical protein SIAM614_15827 [Stappia aggregata IAM 12614]|uniref:Uncharacterized protein n=1 Tax=Roseibium aggregatum (strain ATCC 25650 / DSM 13394 / JCM 20685 / NBRC 16684 / NCIMB 2208 / IAM 12614 / B1) TaxID=384765 RepID=A0NWB2_ROSAI|nr:hypothetical protein SIAM614_15827 [Stappia aggregata IAM 12614] [Roseibium aggregatum IAM 12614]